MALIDPFGRAITYLRVSVTDRCNLRCVYCTPSEEVEYAEREKLLSYEEILRLLRIMAGEGVRKVRITGGEPLVRRDLVEQLVVPAMGVSGVEEVYISTNATLLERHLRKLRQTGLKGFNISLDTMRPETFRRMARRDGLEEIMRAIELTLSLGFPSLKLNAVIMKGINEDEIGDFARLTLKNDLAMRFIEYMPIGTHELWGRERVIPSAEIRGMIEKEFGPLEKVETRSATAGPARYWKIPGARGMIGCISAVTEEFCAGCNRMRLTSDGKLRGCLISNGEVDLRAAFREGASDMDIHELVLTALRNKPEQHHINDGLYQAPSYSMMQLGG
ncbi:GTP 3',8-cyclase MoaA [Candidatus Sumerlaeota bacterium]|nr:GTP 3',8-cyclase MoaA [Candidatus Sumerlaeota bacterium]